MWNTLAAHAQNLTGLGFRGDVDTCLSIQGFDFDVRPEGGLAERDRQIQQYIVPMALEPFVFFHLDQNDDIPGRPTAMARITLAAQGEIITGIDSRRDFDLDRSFFFNPSFAGAAPADIPNNLSGTAAFWAGGHTDKLPDDRSLYAAHLSGALATRTYSGLSSARTRTVTIVTTLHQLYFQGFFHSFGHLGQGQLEADLEVFAPVRSGP